MAWKKGKHAEAPPGALCYGDPEEPGMIWWFEPDGPPARRPPARESEHPPRQQGD